MMRIFYFVLCLLWSPTVVFAQDFILIDTLGSQQERKWAKIFESSIQDFNNSTGIEDITYLQENPLDINTASIEDLCIIPGVTAILAHRIVKHRALHRFTSLEELLTIDGMTPELFSFICQFIKVEKPEDYTISSVSLRSRTSTEIEERKGYQDGSYPGSPVKAYNRFRFSLGNSANSSLKTISACEGGAVTEKDPGEPSLTSFSTGYIKFLFPSLATNLLIGDYTIEVAEGLIFWRSYAFAKGSDVITPTRKNGGGIRPYLSSDENWFLRGIGMSTNVGSVQLQLMYSNKPLNANVDSLGRVTSFDQSGLFRTESELHRKNSTKETLVGLRAVTYLFPSFKIGGTAYRARFANPLLHGVAENGITNDISAHGIDVSYTNGSVDVFSECALDKNKNLAMLGGMNFEPTHEIALSLVTRKYPSSFESLHGFVFGETGGCPENETGVYGGAKVRFTPWLAISGYYDIFAHPYPMSMVPVPSHGDDLLILIESQVTTKLEVEFRLKQKNTPSILDDIDSFGRIVQSLRAREQTNYRFEIDYSSSKSINTSSRIEWLEVAYDGASNTEKGVLLSQLIQWKVWKRFNVYSHICIFHTDSYDSRLYEYENDLPGAFSSPALFGRGIRWYVVLWYQWSSHFLISAKYSQTVKEGVTSIGSGLDEIQGDTESQLSFQLDVRF